MFLQMVIDGACLLDRVLRKACNTVRAMPLAPDVYGEIAALLRKAAMKLSSEVGLRPVRGAPKEWLADGRAVAAHGCRCAPAEPGWADAECHRRPPAAGLDLAGGVRAWADTRCGDRQRRTSSVQAKAGRCRRWSPGQQGQQCAESAQPLSQPHKLDLKAGGLLARHASAGLCVRMPQP